MQDERFGRLKADIGRAMPRRGALMMLSGVIASAGLMLPAREDGAQAKKKRKKKKGPRCRPTAGEKRLDLGSVSGPNLCTCAESQAVLLKQLASQQCVGANDPQCPSKGRCGQSTTCTTIVDRAGAPVGSTYVPNLACPGGVGCVFSTSGNWDCTCGCEAAV